MFEKILSEKIMDYAEKYLRENKGTNTYVNIFNTGIVINLTVIKELIREKGRKYIQNKVELFIKSNF